MTMEIDRAGLITVIDRAIMSEITKARMTAQPTDEHAVNQRIADHIIAELGAIPTTSGEAVLAARQSKIRILEYLGTVRTAIASVIQKDEEAKAELLALGMETSTEATEELRFAVEMIDAMVAER